MKTAALTFMLIVVATCASAAQDDNARNLFDLSNSIRNAQMRWAQGMYVSAHQGALHYADPCVSEIIEPFESLASDLAHSADLFQIASGMRDPEDRWSVGVSLALSIASAEGNLSVAKLRSDHSVEPSCSNDQAARLIAADANSLTQKISTEFFNIKRAAAIYAKPPAKP